MKISNPSLYGSGAASGGLLTTVNYVENRLLGVSGELSKQISEVSDQISNVSTLLSKQIESVSSNLTEDISEINSDLTTLSTQLFTEVGSTLKLNTNIIPDIALNTVHVINAVSGDSLATSVSSLKISESTYTPETAKTLIIEWLSNYAEDKDLDVGDIVIVQPDDSVSSIVFDIKDLLGSWMISNSPASTVLVEQTQVQGQTETTSQYDATKLYVADSTIQKVDGELPAADGNIPLTKLNNSINTINTKITNISGDIQTLNNEVDFLSGVLNGFDNTEDGTVSAVIDNIQTDFSIKTNFLSGVLNGFDDTTSGNVSAYIDNIVNDLNENLIKSEFLKFIITTNQIPTITQPATNSTNLIHALTINKLTETDGIMYKKMFGITDQNINIYQIDITFAGEVNILKLLTQSMTDTNTYIEFHPDFKEQFDAETQKKTKTVVTVFLPESIQIDSTTTWQLSGGLNWRVTYSRKVSSAGQCLI